MQRLNFFILSIISLFLIATSSSADSIIAPVNMVLPVQEEILVEETHSEEQKNQFSTPKECLEFQDQATEYKIKADKNDALTGNYRAVEANFRKLFDDCMTDVNANRSHPGYRLNANQQRIVHQNPVAVVSVPQHIQQQRDEKLRKFERELQTAIEDSGQPQLTFQPTPPMMGKKLRIH